MESIHILPLAAAFLQLAMLCFAFYRMGLRIHLFPIGVEVVEPSGFLRTILVEKIYRGWEKQETTDSYSVHKHKQLVWYGRLGILLVSVGVAQVVVLLAFFP